MGPLAVEVDGVPLLLRFSAHALRRMGERGVAPAEVAEALRRPCEHAYDRERDVYLTLGCNGVAVVYALRGRVVEVVTVLREREYGALVGRLGGRRYRRLPG